MSETQQCPAVAEKACHPSRPMLIVCIVHTGIQVVGLANFVNCPVSCNRLPKMCPLHVTQMDGMQKLLKEFLNLLVFAKLCGID